MAMKPSTLFDAHCHVIDPRFPLVVNAGYLPASYTAADYLAETRAFGITGGAVVSGSFQAFDQDYLISALETLGTGFAGVTQLPSSASEEEIARLDGLGVRALRFNLKRGVHPDIEAMIRLARRAFETAGWHAELYLDSRELPDLRRLTDKLPVLCIDHLGLSRDGLPALLRLVERGAYVKASGFGRVDLPITDTLQTLAKINPDAMLFGTDLPGTRAPRRFLPSDIELVCDALEDEGLIRKTMRDNALHLYKKKPRSLGGQAAG